MNLTELQVELRAIEEHISALHNEIEKMKPQTEEEQKLDFEKITKLANQYPVLNTRIKEAPKEVQKMIIGSLSYLVLAEEKDIYSRLLYLCRLSMGSGCDISAENLYKLGLEFEMSDLDKLSKELVDYKYTYLVEAFIIVNLSEEASVGILSLIADLAKLMDCDKEEIRVLGMMAKSVLMENPDHMLEMPVPTRNRWSGKLRDFITDEWILEHREKCGLLCTSKYKKKSIGWISQFRYDTTGRPETDYTEEHPCEIKKRVQPGSVVKKGDTICTYTERVKKVTNKTSGGNTFLIINMSELNQEYETVEKTITAPCDGVVYFIEDKKPGEVSEKPDEYIAAYVVSYFDDYSEFSQWYKAIRGSK